YQVKAIDAGGDVIGQTDPVEEGFDCTFTVDRTTVVTPECGDGNVDDGEQCDDGNLEDGDGCSMQCMTEVPMACTEWAEESVAFNQGLRKDGSAVLAARSVPTNVLGDPLTSPFKFVSLGFSGSITVELSGYAVNED